MAHLVRPCKQYACPFWLARRHAGRLGLSLRLDRSEPKWSARLLFFRCGDLVVEVVHDLESGLGAGPDRLWGRSWRVPDVVKAHARRCRASVEVCDIRKGRPPELRMELAKQLINDCFEVLGLREDRLNVEFTQHTGDEMYHPTLGGYSPEWSADEG